MREFHVHFEMKYKGTMRTNSMRVIALTREDAKKIVLRDNADNPTFKIRSITEGRNG